MFRNKLESTAFLLLVAGGLLMVLTPVSVVLSEYSLLYTRPKCPCTAGFCPSCPLLLANVPATFHDTINAWTVGGIIAIAGGSLFAALPRLQRVTSGIPVFGGLVYWSGFFTEGIIFSTTNLFFFAWPPFLAIAGGFLAWVSEARGSLSKGFWLSLVGGFLMLSLALPALIFPVLYIRAALPPYRFLAIGSMVFGGMLTVIVSLVLGIFRLAGGAARILSFSGLLYYWLGLTILLAASGGFAASREDPLFNFATLGLLFSLPALAARLVIAWEQRHYQN